MAILKNAKKDVDERISRVGPNARISYIRQYDDPNEVAAMALAPIGRFCLTWGQWGEALEVVKDFYELWDSVALNFQILDAPSRTLLGRGYVRPLVI